MPINMRTHGHGQGYLDLNFLIPELVETVSYRKGMHHPDAGDFSSAGSVEFRYYDALAENVVGLTGSAFQARLMKESRQDCPRRYGSRLSQCHWT